MIRLQGRIASRMSAVGLCALAPLLSAASPVRLPAEPGGQIAFTTPSNNIGCTYTPAGGTTTYQPRNGGPELICERVEPGYVTVILGPKGAVRRIDNPGEQGCCSLGNVLAYGQTWRAGPFECVSRKTGLTCRRTVGRGFALSRAKIATF